MIDKCLAEAARLNYGVLPRGLPESLGVSKRQINNRLVSGQLVRVHRGVLALAGAPRTWKFYAAAALAAVPDSALAEESAAVLHGIDVGHRPQSIVLLAPWNSHHELTGVQVRRTRNEFDDQLVAFGPLRATSLARTLIDLAASTNEARLRRMVADQLRSNSVTIPDLERVLGLTAARGKRGIARFRSVLCSFDDQPCTDSELEDRFVALLTRSGVSIGAIQGTAPWADSEPGRVDMLFEHERLIVELDGRTTHLTIEAFENDRRRDQAALVRGYRTVRFTWKQVTGDPDHVIGTLRRLLGQQTAPHS